MLDGSYSTSGKHCVWLILLRDRLGATGLSIASSVLFFEYCFLLLRTRSVRACRACRWWFHLNAMQVHGNIIAFWNAWVMVLVLHMHGSRRTLLKPIRSVVTSCIVGRKVRRTGVCRYYIATMKKTTRQCTANIHCTLWQYTADVPSSCRALAVVMLSEASCTPR